MRSPGWHGCPGGSGRAGGVGCAEGPPHPSLPAILADPAKSWWNRAQVPMCLVTRLPFETLGWCQDGLPPAFTSGAWSGRWWPERGCLCRAAGARDGDCRPAGLGGARGRGRAVASRDRSHGRACPSAAGDTGGPVRRADLAPTMHEVNVPGSRVADIRVTSRGGGGWGGGAQAREHVFITFLKSELKNGTFTLEKVF